MAEIPTYTLNDETTIPVIGLGTYGLRGAAGVEAVAAAIDSGYRLLDTALNYENEREVGDGIRVSGIDRDELVVTSKIPGRHHGYDETFGSFAESSTNLGLDVIDLYLIHWPLPRVDKYLDTWKAMIAPARRGQGALHRSEQLHRGAPRTHHRGDRRRAGRRTRWSCIRTSRRPTSVHSTNGMESARSRGAPRQPQ